MTLNVFDPVVAFLGMPSGAEWGIVLILLFLLFGAKKIPEMMRSLGRAQGEFQHAKKQFEAEVKATETEATKLGELRAEAKTLGIDPEGKDLATLQAEVDAKKAERDATAVSAA